MPIDPDKVLGATLEGAPYRWDADDVILYQARFGGVLFPGETIVTSLWREDGRIVVAASCKERGTPVIKNAAVRLK